MVRVGVEQMIRSFEQGVGVSKPFHAYSRASIGLLASLC